MAKSKAQKKRQKLVREGRLNPEISRSPYAQLSLRTRKTKNKKDILYRTKHKKNRYPQKHGKTILFYFLNPFYGACHPSNYVGARHPFILSNFWAV